jgi:hypothetical protein
VYSTDNGPHRNSWPDGGMTPFAARRTPTGRARSASRSSCAIPARSSRDRSQMRLSSITTGCRPSWSSRATRESSTISRRG